MHANWIIMDGETRWEEALASSFHKPVLLFKHSTRCPLSSMALNRLKGLDRAFYDQADFYYLDLIAHRSLSTQMAEHFGVQHESPQVLWVEQGQCQYHASHMDIRPAALMARLA
jgi:bacillithiol system protein YtxJ